MMTTMPASATRWLFVAGRCRASCAARAAAAARRHADARSRPPSTRSPRRPPRAAASDRSKASCRCRAAPAASAFAAASSPASKPAARCASKASRRSARRSSSSPARPRQATLLSAARASRAEGHRGRRRARTADRPGARRRRPAVDRVGLSRRQRRADRRPAVAAAAGGRSTLGPDRVAYLRAADTDVPVVVAADYGPWHVDYSRARRAAIRASVARASAAGDAAIDITARIEQLEVNTPDQSARVRSLRYHPTPIR